MRCRGGLRFGGGGAKVGRVTKRQRVLIFANPIAGRGKGRRIAERLRARLASDGYEPRVFLERPDCFELAALEEPASEARAANLLVTGKRAFTRALRSVVAEYIREETLVDKEMAALVGNI
jgi:hypothetical protein